ncbi:uncharacterized protein LOC121942385 isoform X2 [Plectropomus leopardus]|uniref:uncharacterized protein LOC121942385 isoform X2 n=1 Tax=Plectropomus leopardus TaxID=160734 RepID=UPI001C4BC159|nr:uncharacterized protein LOC121942385 isoform X2 [Plectropomus leopardus]
MLWTDSESVRHPVFTASPNEAEQESSAAASVQSAKNGEKSGENNAVCQDDGTTTNQSQNDQNRDSEEEEDEEFSTSLSVGDGRYLVDLGSPSEFIVDEECILQLFKTCRECHKPCKYVRKQVKGLKLVVNQACSSCPSNYKWTNLLEDDEDFQINGKDVIHGQANSALK